MKKIVALIVSVAISFSFADSSCYSESMFSGLEKEVGFDGGDSKIKVSNIDSVEIVKKRLGVVKKGPYAGYSVVLSYTFGPYCKPQFVEVERFDPSNGGLYAGSDNVSLRIDGTVKALCRDGGMPLELDPVTKKMFVNKNCICFDENGRKKPFGKYGCLDKNEIHRGIVR